jgi:aspartokinase/homoserine dehydrogenase 1
LRYIARFDGTHATCQLEEVDSTHPFYSLEDAACAIRIISKRSKQTPYLIKGPGAGKEVTAAMVLTELLEVKLKE